MNQKYWGNIRKSRINKGLTDLLRKKISEEDYERIRKQTYGEYLEELRRDCERIQEHEEYLEELRAARS